MNWHEIPLIRILLPFSLGILFGIHFNAFNTIFNVFLFLSFCLLLSFLVKKPLYYHQKKIGLLLHLCLFFIGYQYVNSFVDNNKVNHFKASINKENKLIAEVYSIKSKEKYLQVVVKAKAISQNGQAFQSCEGNLLLYISKKGHAIPINYKDVLLLQLKIQKIRTSKNPKAFDFEKFMRFKNIYFQANIAEEDFTILKKESSFHLIRLAARWRANCLSILKKHLPTNNEWMVGKALLLGHRDDMETSIKTAFSKSGALHVLAVSGLHVGIIGLIVHFLLSFLKKIPFGRWLKLVLLILSIWCFAILTGASASVLRASTMFSFIILGQALNRNINSYNTLAASALVLLFLNPLLLFDVGFQLSYLAVLGIIYFQKRIYRLFYLKSKLLDYCWQITSVSIAAQITTLPISIYYFHQFPIYFWLSGLLVIPAAFLIVCLGLSVLVFHTLPIVGSLLGKLLYTIIWATNALIFFISELPWNTLSNLWLSLESTLLCYLILALLVFAFALRRARYLLLGIGIFFLLSLSFAYQQWQFFKRKEIVVYQVNGHSVIDLFHRQACVSIKDKALKDKSLTWATANYRSTHLIKTYNDFHFSTAEIRKDKNWFYEDGFVQFYHLKFAIIDKAFFAKNTARPCVDLLIIRDNPAIQLDVLYHDFAPAKIIFDASNSKQNIKAWQKASKHLNVECIFISESGAYSYLFP